MNKKSIIFSLFDGMDLTKKICEKTGYPLGSIVEHHFPDEEVMIRINSDVSGKEIFFVTSLDSPNSKLIPLIFAAETARELGAKKITLIAPYLAYMRQDKQFHVGEGISSRYFSRLISTYFDNLITIDPHLHRIVSLDAIYSIPTIVLHAADPIACWIIENVKNPILVGPDTESKQWVEEIAQKSNSPFLILEKIRKGDRSVQVSIPEISSYQNITPILIDDIISTAMTMIATVNHLKSLQMKPPICIGVHAIFADNAYQNLLKVGVDKIITCNTVKHPSNAIDISNTIAASIV